MNKTAIGIVVLVAAALLIWGVSGTKDKAVNLGEGALDIVKDAGDAVVDGAKDVAEGAADMAEDGAAAVASGANAVVDGAAEVAQDAADMVKDGADAVASGANAVVDNVKEMADDTEDNMEKETPEDGTYAIKTSESALLRKGATPLKSHNGDVQITSGEVTIKDGMITAGEFEIDMTTIDTIDLKEDEVDGMDEHLYGEDFFDVEKFPKAMLVITDVSGDTITADLTIKGQTHPVTFDVDLDGNKAMAAFEIDRTVWGIEYNSPSLVDAIKDKAINDEIEFDVTLMW